MKKIILLGLVCLLLTGCAGAKTAGDTAPAASIQETAPETTKANPITIAVYKPDANCEKLEAIFVKIEEINAQNILQALAECNVISGGITVQSEGIEKDSAGSHLRLDFNQELQTSLSSLGTAGEYAVLGAIVNTFLDAYCADDIYLSVNGHDLETGHNVYTEPLTKFSVEF